MQLHEMAAPTNIHVRKWILVEQPFILVSHVRILTVGPISQIRLPKQLIQTMKRKKINKKAEREMRTKTVNSQHRFVGRGAEV